MDKENVLCGIIFGCQFTIRETDCSSRVKNQLAFKQKEVWVIQRNKAPKIIDRAESLLSDIPRLAPHLNKSGKEMLSEIITTYENILKGNELASRLAHVKHKLDNTFPSLAKTEIDISALLVSGFSTVEISTYGGYSASNASTALYRICKKMEVQSLDELLLKVFQPIHFPGRFYPEAGNFLK